MERRLILHTRTFDVFAHDAVSCLVVLDKIAVSSAARKRLNAKLTGARKQVEHLGTAHMILYQIEYVFFYPIGGRAGVHAGHGLQFTAPRSSGYNSHGSLLLKSNCLKIRN